LHVAIPPASGKIASYFFRNYIPMIFQFFKNLGHKNTCAFAIIGHHPSATRHFFVTSKFNIFNVSYTAFSLLT
jgi:hypothetical protein